MSELQLPEQLNAATVFVDRHLDEGRGQKPAILCGERTLTYAELAEAVNRTGNALTSLDVLAEFSNLGQWQRQQQVLSSTPGVRNMQIGSLSGRSARIALSYPGGGAALQGALGTRGLTLENINGFWILR